MLLTRIERILQDECLLKKDVPTLVGVSGGPDSLCLLDVLHRLGYALIVAHFDHRLREEAASEQAFVVRMARQRGLPVVTGQGDVEAFRRETGQSLEEAARSLRYRFLFEQAARHNAQAVAVGHTADDQVETVLMHLLRGAGLDGLKGMTPRGTLPTWSREIPLVRPLLHTWRDEVLAWCRENELQPLFDRSNLDTTLFRNRLRHELIPLLEGYNPRFRERVLRTAQTLAADHAIIEGVVSAAWQGSVLREGKAYVCMSRRDFLAQLAGVQARLLRRAIRHLRPDLRDVDFDALARAAAFLRSGRRHGQCDLVGGLSVFLEGERFWIARHEADLPTGEWPQMPEAASLRLDVPGGVQLAGGWRLIAQPSPAPGPQGEASEAWLDADRLVFPLTVRPRQPGDRFQPLGMAGQPVKLSEFMINVKVPRRARARWPLVCSGERIAWVPGYRPGHPFRITSRTRRFVRLALERG